MTTDWASYTIIDSLPHEAIWRTWLGKGGADVLIRTKYPAEQRRSTGCKRLRALAGSH